MGALLGLVGRSGEGESAREGWGRTAAAVVREVVVSLGGGVEKRSDVEDGEGGKVEVGSGVAAVRDGSHHTVLVPLVAGGAVGGEGERSVFVQVIP